MQPYFTSETQKTRCLEAIEDSILMWKKIKDIWEDSRNKRAGWPGLAMLKGLALEELYEHNKKAVHFFRNCDTFQRPKHECFLCQYVEEYTKTLGPKKRAYAVAYRAAGFDCQALCPVIWDKKKNPDNKDTGSCNELTTPCETSGTPYADFFNSLPADCHTAIDRMCSLLQKSLSHVRTLPVRTDPQEETEGRP